MSIPAEFKKALLESSAGSKLKFPFFLDFGPTDDIEAVVVEIDPKVGWTLACYWRGVNLGDVFACIDDGVLVLEVV